MKKRRRKKRKRRRKGRRWRKGDGLRWPWRDGEGRGGGHRGRIALLRMWKDIGATAAAVSTVIVYQQEEEEEGEEDEGQVGFASALVRGGGGREGGRVVASSSTLPSSSSLTAAAAFRLPLAVRRAVWEENMTFFQDKHRFDPHYARFLWQLLCAPFYLPSSSSSTAAVARLRAYAAGIRFALEVLLHARASSCVPPWFHTLRSLLLQPEQDEDEGGREDGREGGVRRCGLWTVMYLADDPQGRKAGLQALLFCPHLASRREVVGLMVAAAREVVKGGGGRGLLEVRKGGREGGRELAHPLARLVAWYLVVVTHCAGVDGGLLSPPPEEGEEDEGGREGGPSPSPTQHAYYHPPTPSSITSYGGGGREGGMGGGSTVLFDITPEVLLLLLELAALGPVLRRLLRGLGRIARLAALVASFNGGDNRYLLLNHPLLVEEILSLALRLLAALAEEASPDELHSPSHLSALSSRRFVEMAATYQPEHTSLLLAKFVTTTSSTSSSLPPSHVLDQQHLTAATAAVIRVLVDRALEAAALASQPPPSLPPSTSSYAPSPSSVVFVDHQRRLISLGAKPLLRVLQAVLGVVEEGGREGGEQQAWRLEQSLPFLDRCTRVLTRAQGGGRVGGRAVGLSVGEMDLIWSVARLYFSLAARSPVAAAFVTSRVEGVVREWRRMMGTMGGGGGGGKK